MSLVGIKAPKDSLLFNVHGDVSHPICSQREASLEIAENCRLINYLLKKNK